MNIGFSLGGPINSLAKAHGANPVLSNTAVWLPLLWAGAIPNLIYCGILLRRNTSYSRFAFERNAFYWLGCLLMAVFWFGGIVLYSVGAGKMGRFRVSGRMAGIHGGHCGHGRDSRCFDRRMEGSAAPRVWPTNNRHAAAALIDSPAGPIQWKDVTDRMRADAKPVA